MEELNFKSMTLDDLLSLYHEKFAPEMSKEEIAGYYGIALTKKGKVNNQSRYADKHNKVRMDIIEDIKSIIESEAQEEKDDLRNRWIETVKDIEPEELPNYEEYDKLYSEYYNQQKQIQDQQHIIEEQQKQIRDAQNYIEELKQKLSKLIKEEIPQEYEKFETKRQKAKISKLIVDGINNWHEDVFKPSHDELSFDDYIEKTKENAKKIKDIIDEINKNQDKLIVNFDQFDDKGKEQIKETILNWLGNQPTNNHYLIHYRVGDEWKSAPLNHDALKKLEQRLNDNGLIYDMEKTPSWTYDADNKYELPEWNLFSEIRILSFKPNYKTYKDNGGHFFEYLNNSPQFERVNEYFKRLQIFDKLSLDGKTQREELNDCCLIYALKISGLFSEEELNLMRMRIKTRYLSFKTLKELCQEFHIKIIKHKIDEEAKGKNKTKNEIIGNKEFDKTIYLCQYRDHYFIDELTPFTSYFIKHIDELTEDDYNKRMKDGKMIEVNPKEKSRFMSSSDLVREWFKQNRFTPITYATASILKSDLYDHVKDEDYPLEFDEESCLKLICPKEQKSAKPKSDTQSLPSSYWYADFEADTSGKTHKPYMCVVQSADGKINKTFKGVNCAKQFLESLPDNAICYFHNFAYDWCMFNRLASRTTKTPIKKGSKLYKTEIKYYKKKLTFKDTYPIFMCKLADLPKAFKLEGIKKELFPYNYYTLNRLRMNRGIINEAGKYEAKRWTEDDYKTFKENIDSIKGCRIDENTFDMYKYAEFYCNQDVRILREAFEKLCKGFMDEFQINVKECLTTPALANKFFSREVYEPNGNLYMVGGHVREFISRAVYGGRCMTAYNKKWHTTKNICDYDAVSLYPSAMRRLWTVEGKPKVLKVEDSEKIYSSMPDYLLPFNTKNGKGAFVVEIKIIAVNKHFAFPLIVQHTSEGNLNKDTGIDDKNPVFMVVDNIMLEDLIEFQQIEFQIIKGYVWEGNRDYKIQDVIQKVFDSRLKYKDEKNPLEQLYKLIMNSSYGKTIQKPVESELKFVSKWKKSADEPSEYERYIQKNYNKIIDIIEINDDGAYIKSKKQIDKHFNFSLLGIQVLSMSKRIMNEVVCLAFDIGAKIYYTDTDSVHIEANDVPRLEEAFEKKYDRPLRGKAIGQFHSDFPKFKDEDGNERDEVPWAIESYFIMKKVYIDRLTDSTGDIKYMIRGKGLTQQSIKYAGGRKGGLMKLYRDLFKGKEISFDLTEGQPSFEMNNNFTVSTRKAFIRKVKTNYKMGKSNQYFNYSNC